RAGSGVGAGRPAAGGLNSFGAKQTHSRTQAGAESEIRMKTITIDPVTRIEGHGKITLQLDEQGYVSDAHFHVTQFRGFEKFCEGRPFYEMPSLMARICG